MIGRREFVLGATAAGVAMQPRLGYAKASQPATNVNFDVPAGACDCHTHIHGDPAVSLVRRAHVYARDGAAGRNDRVAQRSKCSAW